MGLKDVIRALRVEVRARRHVQTFEEASTRHDTLARYPDALSVLRVLADESKGNQNEKELLTWALVREQRDHPHELWAGMLVLAYSPMLFRLRGRLSDPLVAGDEIEQLILTSFLEVVASFPRRRVPGRTCGFLRFKTLQRTSRALRGEIDARSVITLLEPEELAEHALEDHRDLLPDDPGDAAEIAEEAVEMLRQFAGDEVDARAFELVADTLVRGERLRHYVTRHYPEAQGPERARIYQRLKRRRSRTIVRLRRPLRPLREAVFGGRAAA